MFLVFVSWIAFVVSSGVLVVGSFDVIKNGAPYGLNWNVIGVVTAIWVASGHYIFDIV